jgi:hypothetical protein
MPLDFLEWSRLVEKKGDLLRRERFNGKHVAEAV